MTEERTPYTTATLNETVVWLDIETDRLDPLTANPIQVACIATDRMTLEEIDRFEIKILFDIGAADPSALERNCYDAKAWVGATELYPSLVELGAFFRKHSTWERISKRSGKTYTTCEIGGHNIAAYDAVILSEAYKRCAEFCPAATWTTGPVDTMHWARSIEFARGERWETGFSLKALCERFGIVLDNEHDALADVKATVELARKLKGVTIESN